MNEGQRKLLHKYAYDMVRILVVCVIVALIIHSPPARKGSWNPLEIAICAFSAVAYVGVTAYFIHKYVVLKWKSRKGDPHQTNKEK